MLGSVWTCTLSYLSLNYFPSIPVNAITVSDRQTERKTTYCGITELRVASCGKNNAATFYPEGIWTASPPTKQQEEQQENSDETSSWSQRGQYAQINYIWYAHLCNLSHNMTYITYVVAYSLPYVQGALCACSVFSCYVRYRRDFCYCQ